ncbi:hypothetical protein IEQ44_01480 [Nocardioides sp. Y6]|uniref:Uncharacterized protein n=1 Tax=Nocardioides malaquae TaxID=2773426 RepID=A0ABR9RP21_9ACTN|nr:hypothetical protein [Nocardioides malaquae]MBE7323324.1 hypothetical protein [Nocardioides malaquae]
MTGTTVLASSLLGLALLAAALGWRLHGNRFVAALVIGSTLAAVLPVEAVARSTPGEATTAALVVALAVLAVAGGGPVTAATFRLVDGPGAPRTGSVRRAAEVLRGGAWIGALERVAVFASLASGWPEGLALTLAIKGLGRYPELRHEERPGIAERFLIGTFVSVLWACACAGLALRLL